MPENFRLGKMGFVERLHSYTKEQTVAKPFSGPAVKPKGAEPLRITATVMEINNGIIPNIVVAEKVIMITSYKFGDQIKKTQLVGNYGHSLSLKELKVGQHVIFDALQLTDGTLLGERLEVKYKCK